MHIRHLKLLVITAILAVQPIAIATAFNLVDIFKSEDQQRIEFYKEIMPKMEVIDPVTDVAYLEDGERVYKFYSVPRLLQKDGEKIVEAPAGFNLFDEEMPMRLFESETGYNYSVPLSNSKSIDVRAGNMQKSGKTVPYQTSKYAQFKEESMGATVTKYVDLYPSVDVEFWDLKQWRERKIVIKNAIKDLTPNEYLTFWENYILPDNAVVKDHNGNKLSGTVRMKQTALNVETTSGEVFSIGSAMIADASENDLSAKDLEQTVVINYTTRSMSIGIHLDAAYLLNKERVYPVTIDPIYYACKPGNLGGLNCSVGTVTDLYLRYLTSRTTNTADLFMGYYNAPDGPASRVIVAKFTGANDDCGADKKLCIPAGDTVTRADLILTFDKFGFGNFAGNVTTVARKIRDNWTVNNIQYANIRNRLLTVSPQVTVSTNASEGDEFIYEITSAFRDWLQLPAENYGVAVEPTPAFLNAIPPWPNKLFIFRSSRSAETPGPYLIVMAQAAARPDLTSGGSTLNHANASYQPGETITITNTVRNVGNAASGANSKIYYYFKAGADTPRDARYYVGQAQVGNINAGASAQVNFSYRVPANSAAGNYKFYYWIDAENVIAESEEGNNAFNWTITVPQPQLPDLTYNNARISTNQLLPGEAFRVMFDVKNTGAVATQQSGYVYYYFSKDDPSFDAGKKINESDFFGTLNPNDISSETADYTIPDGTAQGTYYFSLWIDARNGGEIAEANENNNRYSFQVAVIRGQDLRPTDISIQNPRNMVSGEQISVRARIRNTGNLAANNLGYFLGIRDENSSQIYPIGGGILNLGAGYDDYINFSGNIPHDIPLSSNYRAVITLDPNDAFDETNDNNNTGLSDQVILIERNGYCGGCGGGGGAPPPPETLPDTDHDTYSDVEEKYAGTNVFGAQSLNLFAANAMSLLSSTVDHIVKAFGGDPVNIRTGAFEFTQTDFELKGRGIPINITRTYNSRVVDKNNRIGNGWNLSTNMYYYQDPDSKNVLIYLGGTLAAIFTTADGGNTFTAPKGVDDILIKENDNLVYKTIDGVKYVFSKKLTTVLGMIERISDTNGNSTVLNYIVRSDVPLLSSITDASNRTVNFVYGDENDDNLFDKVIEIRDNINPANPQGVKYEYLNGNLIKVTSTRSYNGQTENISRDFTYNGNLLAAYTDPRGTILYNYFDAGGRVTAQYEFNSRVDAVGSKRLVFDFNYSDVPDLVAPGSVSCTTVKNYRDQNASYSNKTCFNSDGLKIYEADGLNNATRYQYDNNGMPISITDPNGNVRQYEYDNRRRVTKETAPDTSSWHTEIVNTYENNFNKLVQKQETSTSLLNPPAQALARTTRYTVDQNNGNILEIIDALGNKQTLAYDQFGNVSRLTDKNGNQTAFEYTQDGNYLTRESTVVIQADGSPQTIAKQYSYDAYGNRLSLTTGRNNAYNYEYDTHGNLKKVTDPARQVSLYSYDAEGHKVSETNPLGRTTVYTYDRDTNASLLEITKTGPADVSLSVRHEYDFAGNLMRDINARGVALSYAYNSANRVIQKTGPADTLAFVYDANGNKTRETNSLGQRTDYSYDARNNLLSIKKYLDANTFVETKYEYDGLNRRVKTTDANGNATTIAYNLMDRVTLITDPEGNSASFAYDAIGNKISEADPRGNSTVFTYDGLSRLIKTQNALNQETHTFYNEDDNVVRVIDRQNSNGTMQSHVTRFAYDNLGRKQRETDAYNNAIIYEYDPVGNLKKTTDKMNRQTNYQYDDFNRLVLKTDPAGNTTSYIYDENGNKTRVIEAGAQTNYEYDNADRLTRVIDADQNSVQYVYDAVGNKTRETNKRGFSTQLSYDALNRLIEEQNAQGTVTAYTYDNNGNRRTETTGNRIVAYSYDILNRLVQVTHPGGKTERTAYDPNGNVLTKEDGNGQVTNFTYDALNRTTQKRLADNAVTAYSYDNWGNLLNIAAQNGTMTYEYDDLNRQTRETKTIQDLAGKSYVINRTYNPDSSLAGLTDAAGRTVSYTYDNRGLADEISYDGRQLAKYTHTAFGQPLELTYANGIKSNYSYDSLRRMTGLNIANAQDQNIFSQAYTYDANNNRTHLAENISAAEAVSSRTVDYGYDNLDQLTSVDYSDVGNAADLQFTYDAVGNRLSLSSPLSTTRYAYAANSYELGSYTVNNKLSVTMEYDGNGALTKETYVRLGKPLKEVNYSWDLQKRLTQIGYKDAARQAFLPPVAENNLTFDYDDLGNRIKKSANNADTEYYINSGLNVLNELDAGGTVKKTIVQGIKQIAEINENGQITFTHTDVLGSTVMLSNEAGEIAEQYDYDVFGTVIGSLGNADTKYLFTGQEFDGESGFYYYNARYYDAQLGRFLSRDVYLGKDGDSVSRNGYIYTRNNPLRYTDPSGHYSFGEFWDDTVSAAGAVKDFSVDAAIAVKDTAVNSALVVADAAVTTAVAVKDTAVAVKDWACSGVNCGTIVEGVKQIGLGTLQGAGGGFQFVGGGLLATGGSETVVAIPVGIGIAGMGVNNIWAGGTQIGSGISNIIGGFQDQEAVDKSYDPASEAIDAFVEDDTLNTVAHLLYLGADIASIGGAGGALSKATKIESQMSKSEDIIEGIYKFTSASGKDYVGESSNIAKRLVQHLRSGKLTAEELANVQRLEVTGGKTARKIMEQNLINELGGIKSGNLLNKINSIGVGRSYLLKDSVSSGVQGLIKPLMGGLGLNGINKLLDNK